jgi:hypothetical protein
MELESESEQDLMVVRSVWQHCGSPVKVAAALHRPQATSPAIRLLQCTLQDHLNLQHTLPDGETGLQTTRQVALVLLGHGLGRISISGCSQT